MKKLIGSVVLALMLCAASPFVPRVGAEAVKDRQNQLRALTGHVMDRQDQPLGKAIVYLKNTKTLLVKTYICDPDGSYRFPALSPNVDYEVYAEFNGARSDTKTLSAFDNRTQFNITLHIK